MGYRKRRNIHRLINNTTRVSIMKLAKKAVLAATALPLILSTSSAYAFGHHDHDEGRHGKSFMKKCEKLDKKILKKLDLTSEQKDELKQIRQNYRDAKYAEKLAMFETKLAERKAYQTKMNELLLAKDFDEAAVQELASSMVEKQKESRMEKRGDKQVEMLKLRHEMLSILTPEQKEQYKELKEEKLE